MPTLIIPTAIVNQIESHARAESPNECCGMLGGNSKRVFTHHPLRNLSPTPARKYFASPEDIFVAMREMRASGHELVAIYHSHPRGRAYPSPTDIELAYYTEVVYVILSLSPEMETRAFSIRKGSVDVVEITIEDRESLEPL